MAKAANCLIAILLLIFLFPLASQTSAIVNPLTVANNKFGIHLISPTPTESSPAASLVNSSGGDWGYITVLIEDRDRKKDKWQEFFNDLRRRHLIPLVRIATHPEGESWKIPNTGEENEWADFLNNLNWPTKNRYVIVFNEPNHATEWGNKVDARAYAQVLDAYITALKNKSEDFFILNAGFDASAPQQIPNYQDEVSFMQEMNNAVPGIFEKLDAWDSHSYPNPGFVGSPTATGRGTVGTWYWELQQLRNLGVSKILPVFITETGWKHAEGLAYSPNFPTSEKVAEFYQTAFENAWNSERIVAVTPFLLTYEQSPFDHFSFKMQDSKGFYPQFQKVLDLPKRAGKPVQENLAKLEKGEVYSSIVAGETYSISLKLKNTGQSIWQDIQLIALQGGKELGIYPVQLPKDTLIEPGQEYTFTVHLKAPQRGIFKVSFNLFSGFSQFDSPPIEFTTEVKEPVILQLLTKLKWKNSAAGDYLLSISGAVGDSTQAVSIDEKGKSAAFEAKYLLPDYTFNFTLEKPNYKPKTIQKKLATGENTLDFGELQPELISNIFNPKQLWKLLPFSK